MQTSGTALTKLRQLWTQLIQQTIRASRPSETASAFSEHGELASALLSKLSKFFIFLISFGQRLANCVDVAFRMLRAWNNFLLNIHVEGQTTGNQAPNLSVKVLAETSIFDARDSFPALINNELRQMLGDTLGYRQRMEGFLDDISAGVNSTVLALQQCDRRLEEDLAIEIAADLERASRC